jgi:Spy/CpxP family protein refolding chaperone
MARFLFAMTLLTALSLGSDALAQERAGRQLGGGRMLSAVMLLGQEAVQSELELTADQKEKIAALGERLRGGAGNIREMSQEERQKWMAEMQERMTKAEERVREFLSDDQVSRLQQIRVQAMGASAAADPEIAAELGITEAQQEKMANVRREMREGAGDGDRGAMRERMEKAMAGILTPEQKEKLEKMRGEAFDVSSLQLWGGLGGRRGAQ